MSADIPGTEPAVGAPSKVAPVNAGPAGGESVVDGEVPAAPVSVASGSTNRGDADRVSTEFSEPGPSHAGRRFDLIRRTLRRQEVGYVLVGGFNTVFGTALTVVWLTFLPDTAWAPPAAVALAYAISVVVAFVLHRRLVFRVRGRVLRDFAGFVAVNSGGLVLNMALLSLAVTVLDLPKTTSTVVVMGLVAIAGFFGHRHISFRRRPVVEADGAVR